MELVIRRATPDDGPAFARIMADPEVFSGVLQLPYPSAADWRQRLTESSQPGRADLVLVAERSGEIVGDAGLHPAGTALRRRHVMSLGITVAKHAQGQGVGRALMAALCDYADRWGQVLRIELQVYADNTRAIRLYEHFGFVVEGTHRAYALRDGVYVDALTMARLHPSPPVLPRP